MTHSLAGRAVFVTGGTGFLGRRLLARLVRDGATVTALARTDEKCAAVRELGARPWRGDVGDGDLLQEGMDGSEIVLHVAARLDGSYQQMYPVTVEGTRNVMEAAARAGVRRVVHVSSVAVYGLAGQRPVLSEDSPLAPAEYPYVTTKTLAEEAVRSIAQARGLEYAIMRPGMIYGPEAGLWTRGLFQYASRSPLVWLGDGSGSTSLIYVDDVVDLLCTLGAHPAAAGETFNCVMDPAPSWRDYMTALQALSGGRGWISVPMPVGYAAAGVVMLFAPRQNIARDLPDGLNWLSGRKRYAMDKARDRLGWVPSVSMEDGVARSAEWLRTAGLLVPA